MRGRRGGGDSALWGFRIMCRGDVFGYMHQGIRLFSVGRCGADYAGVALSLQLLQFRLQRSGVVANVLRQCWSYGPVKGHQCRPYPLCFPCPGPSRMPKKDLASFAIQIYTTRTWQVCSPRCVLDTYVYVWCSDKIVFRRCIQRLGGGRPFGRAHSLTVCALRCQY